MTPPRILRAEARNLDPTHPTPATTHPARHARILKIALSLFANHGFTKITFTAMAIALEIDPKTLRKHFADLPALLGEILRNHLTALSTAIGEIPFNAPDRQAQQRAIYHAFTHTPLGGLTEAHLLLTRDAHLLPDDERIPIQQTHQNFGEILAPFAPNEALALLDSPYLTAPRIETMLAPLQPPKIAPTAKTEERKSFFSEEKKQKTFIPNAPPIPPHQKPLYHEVGKGGAHRRRRWEGEGAGP